MNKPLYMGLTGLLEAIIAHDGDGEFDIAAAKPFAKKYLKELEETEKDEQKKEN